MIIKIAISLLVSMFFLFGEATAYFNETTHPEISEKAVSIYNLNANIDMLKLGSKEEDLPGKYETVRYGIPIKQWRSYNHFLDPYTSLGYHDITGNWSNARDFALSSEVQRNWLKSIGRDKDSRDFFQIYSYDEAKRLYLDGNTSSAYRALGHVAHLLQDMGSPPHVWNDAHVWDFWFISNPLIAAIPIGVEYEYEYYVSDIYYSSVNSNKGNIIQTNDPSNLFNNFAVETRINFFSEDHIEVTESWKNEHNANVSIVNSKKYVTGSLIGDHIPANYAGKNDFKFARMGLFSRWAPNSDSVLQYILDDEVHMNYWEVLSYKATLYTASLISLFQNDVAPGSISVNPSSGSWNFSPQNLSVSSANSTIIYYTMVNTLDGSTPADPREPTNSNNDGSISVSSGVGTFQLYATANQNKRSKLRFRGYNGGGAGPTSSVYEYRIDLRPVAVVPTIAASVPHNGSSFAYTPINITIIHHDATAICYTMVNTYNGDTPADPRAPTISDNDGCINDVIAQVPVWSEGWGYGIFNLYATAGQYKRSKIRFRAFNNTGAGPTSDVYSFTINLRDLPGALTVNPSSGSWNSPNWNSDFSTNLEVGGNNATAIYFTMANTYDGSTPSDPREPTSSNNDGYINVYHTDPNTSLDTLRGFGNFSLYAYNGQYKRSKLRFRAYNSVGAGPASGVYSYTIALASIPGGISVNPSSGSWTSTPHNLSVSSSNSTILYYTMVNTYNGDTPATPREPSSTDNDGYILVSGGTGTFQLYGAAGQDKRSNLRFRGYNNLLAGPASGTYSYSIDLR